jgi:hypothetical protein
METRTMFYASTSDKTEDSRPGRGVVVGRGRARERYWLAKLLSLSPERRR